MMTFKEAYELGALKLKAAGIDEYSLDSKILLEYVTGISKDTLYSHPETEIGKEESERYLGAIDQRGRHIPLQHITGEQWFMGLRFKVNKDVLIPRQDTECLVEEVLHNLHDGMSILDMCTGSGCILLSLLHYSNDCTAVGVDLSERALDVAKENAQALGMQKLLDDGRLSFVKSDIFENVTGTYDIIVSNPPYIVTCEIESLMPEVRDHEPFMALNGKEDGLFFYTQIVKNADRFLKKGGYIAFEIGNTQGREVSDILKNAGYTEVTVIKDYCGNDRVVSARRSVL